MEKSKRKEILGANRPHIYNEYSRLRKVMVVPTPQRVTTFSDLVVNPIQAKAIASRKGEVIELPQARNDHAMLLSTLQVLGVELIYSHVLPGKDGHTPLFTRDIGVCIGDSVVVSHMRHAYRAGEVKGLEVLDPDSIVRVENDYGLEGGDVAVLDDKLVLVGMGPRSNANGLAVLRTVNPDWEILPVEPVVAEKAFHLDTAMGILGEGKIVYLPELLQPWLVEMLRQRGYLMIEADRDEYETCCTNVLAVDDGLIVAAAENVRTNERIRAAGVEVVAISMREILTMGGGPHCLTLPIARG